MDASKPAPPNAVHAIVAAAGFSARMNAFKPLLPIGGVPILAHVVDRLREAGAESIVVATGHRADEIRAALSERSFVHFAHNEDYAGTGMLESLQCGLRALTQRCGPAVFRPGVDIFFMPGDIPLVRAETMRTLRRILSDGREGGIQACLPRWRGRDGHPVLLDGPLAERLAIHSGPEGLRGFLIGLPSEAVLGIPLPDPCVRMDADSPEDYERLLQVWAQREIPDVRLCLAMLRHHGTPEPVIRHAKAVAREAARLACRAGRKPSVSGTASTDMPAGSRVPDCIRTPAGSRVPDCIRTPAGLRVPDCIRSPAGTCVPEFTSLPAGPPAPVAMPDMALLRAAALLHDIARVEPDHALAGAGWLRAWGWERIASVVETHMDLPESLSDRLNEQTLLYLADKRTDGSRIVEIGERLAALEADPKMDGDGKRAARVRLERAARIEALL